MELNQIPRKILLVQRVEPWTTIKRKLGRPQLILFKQNLPQDCELKLGYRTSILSKK